MRQKQGEEGRRLTDAPRGLVKETFAMSPAVVTLAPATNTHWPFGVAGAVGSSFLWVLAFRLLSGAHTGPKSHLPKYTNPTWLSGVFVVICATASTALALCFASGTLVHGMAAITMVSERAGRCLCPSCIAASYT